jgi:putative ABC transport system permease protein
MLTSKLYVISVIASLSVGVGAVHVGFAAAHRVLYGSLPFPASDQIVFGRAVWSNATSRGTPFATSADYLDFREMSTTLEEVAAIAGASVTSMTGMSLSRTEEGSEYVAGGEVSYNFFSALGVRPVLGRNFLKEDEAGTPNTAIISARMWSTRFARDSGVVGKTLTLDGVAYNIVGVMPDGFDFPRGADVWTPLPFENARKARRNSPAGIRAVLPIGRLRPSVSLAAAQAEMDVIAKRLAEAHPDLNTGVGLQLMPAREALFGNLRLAVITFAFAGACVLLVSIFNVVQLNVARTTDRTREIAIRLALGAGPKELLRQLFFELCFVCLVGGFVGTVLGELAEKKLSRVGLAPEASSNESPLLISALLLCVTIACALIAAVSALKISLNTDTSSLRTRTTMRHPSQQAYFRAITIAQIALAFVLVTGTGLLLFTVINLNRIHPGFDSSQTAQMLLTFPPALYPTRESRVTIQREIVTKLRENPTVHSAGMIDALPLVGSTNTALYRRTIPKEDQQGVTYATDIHWLSPGALEALQASILQGRGFEEREGMERTNSVLINRELARQVFPDGDAVGQSLTFGTGTGLPTPQVVIGIVENVKHRSLQQQSTPTVYKASYGLMWVYLLVRKRADPVDLLALRQLVLDISPNLPRSELAPLQNVVDKALQPRRYETLLVGVFSAATILLACFGVFATALYSVGQRAPEFALRKALGATNGLVGWQVVRESLSTAIPGLMLGMGISLVICRLVSANLYGINYYDPVVYALSALVMGLAIVLSAAIPASVAASIPLERASRAE